MFLQNQLIVSLNFQACYLLLFCELPWLPISGERPLMTREPDENIGGQRDDLAHQRSHGDAQLLEVLSHDALEVHRRVNQGIPRDCVLGDGELPPLNQLLMPSRLAFEVDVQEEVG